MNTFVMTVITKEFDGIFLIGINRPTKKNCVNHETAVQLLEAFKSFNATPKHKVAILYGEGGTFCAGYDLQEVSEGRHMEKGPEFVDFIQKHRFLGPTNLKIEKPIIAAIEGYAVAGGFELTLMADLRVVADDAIMGVFCRRVGVPLIDGGTVRLPKIIGLGRALDIILTGRDVYAKEAKEIGLATMISPKGQALNKAIDLARLIMKHPEACMLTDRQSVFNSSQCSHDDAMGFEYEKGQEVLVEAIEGAKKFTKRSRSKL
ncbi:unnamed protein product, partial [Mesorhabditis belari]|uniref:Enoyl-CoA hydratase n=1 Tax=Mesorhabditis belari TaxID=2138241 RepID=A0AAF3EQV8_9BILA